MDAVVKSCSFCGSDNVQICMLGGGEFVVECDECHAVGPVSIDSQSAISLWNIAWEGAQMRESTTESAPIDESINYDSLPEIGARYHFSIDHEGRLSILRNGSPLAVMPPTVTRDLGSFMGLTERLWGEA
ncbi:MAG: hypothetical protein ACR2IJ_03570 [Fluviibacter sp.]